MAGAYHVPSAMIGADLLNYAYPFPVQWFEAQACGSAVRMAYMDVAPTQVANGRTLVLLHGKEFTAASWGETIHALTSAGYRVIAPIKSGSANRPSRRISNTASRRSPHSRRPCSNRPAWTGSVLSVTRPAEFWRCATACSTLTGLTGSCW